MEERKTPRKKGLWLILTALLVLAIGILGAKPAWYLWQEATFYWSDRTETELKVKAFAEENGLFYGQYPRSLIELLERNPETEEFVLQYPLYEKEPLDLSGYSREEVPLFLQWDSQWGYETYGGDFLANTGCGPTCLAMVGWYLTGEESMNPAQIADFAQRNGYYAKGYGSSWTLISEGAFDLGLSATELPLVKKKITDALERGNPVILAMGAGDFTTTGHYIVLTGVEDGAFRVNDPNSRENSRKLWVYEQIESQIRNIWEMALPEDGKTVEFHGMSFDREDLSEDTLTWLEWYNGLSEDEQLAISYIPADLQALMGYDPAQDAPAETQ